MFEQPAKESDLYVLFPHLDEVVESWLVPAGPESYLYIPWHSLLLELSQTGRQDVETFANTGIENPTVIEIKQLIEENPAPLSRSRDSEEFAPTLVGLGLTDLCPLRCVYCHSDAGPSVNHRQLSFEVAKASLILAANNAKRLGRKLEVGLTGPGEPTAAWDLLVRCTNLAYELANDLGLESDLSIATNGYYGSEKREYLVENFDGVSLSFDGFEEIQNLHRPTVNNRGTFKTVFETAQYFHDNWGKGRKGFRFALRATVSQQSLERLDEMHEFFRDSFPKAKIGYEMLNPIGRGATCFNGTVTIPNQEVFLKRVAQLIRTEGSDRVVNSGASRIGELRKSFCKALAMPSLNVTPDGRLVACQRDGAPEYYEYGWYDNTTGSFVLDQQRIEYFRALTVDTYPECKCCIAKYHCAGDCNDLRRVGVKRCNINRELVRMFLSETVHS